MSYFEYTVSVGGQVMSTINEGIRYGAVAVGINEALRPVLGKNKEQRTP